MGRYSRANLLDEELSLIGSSDFFRKLIHRMNKSSTVLLTIEVPLNLFLRAEILCEDIRDLSEMSFVQNDLINLLYNDLLLFAKKNPDPKGFFKLLTSSDQQAGKNARFEKHGKSSFKYLLEVRSVLSVKQNKRSKSFRRFAAF